MADKRHLHHIWTKIRPVRSGYFLIIAMVMLLTFVLAYRQNDKGLIPLRDAVFQADRDNGDVETALRDLRHYVHSHMHADLTSKEDSIRPPIQLKYRYDRLVRAEKERVSAINEKVYTDAQGECERRIPTGRIADRVPCVQEYVTGHTVKENPIPDALYKFDFISPAWSPDLAGYSLLFTGLFFLLFVMRLGLELWLGHRLRQHL